MLNNSSVLSSMTFLRNRSYTTQLLSVFNANGQNLDKNIQTEVVYLTGLSESFRLRWSLSYASKAQTIWCGRRHASLVYRLPKWKISNGHFGKCCQAIGPRYIGSSSGQLTWSSSFCSLYFYGNVTLCVWGEGSG